MAKKNTGNKRYSARRDAGAQRARRVKLRRILFSIIVLAIVAATVFFLVLRGNGQISIFENAVGSLLTPVQNAVTSVTRTVRDFFGNWRSYDALQAQYDATSLENEQLKMQLISAEEALAENERLKALIDAQDTYTALDPIYAKVIARDAGAWFETFSVNRGSNSGVRIGMAVVNGDGLIGRVYEVGLNYSKIISIIDARNAVACLVQRTRDNGVMRGQISDSDETAQCYVYYLPNVNSISPGDSVVTSGTDSLYPKGLKIGAVTALSLDAGAEGAYAVVTPSVDFQRIEEVFILRTVIETDSDNLPAVAANTAAATASPTPGVNLTPSPSPSPDVEYWAYPTPTVAGSAGDLSQFKVGDVIEDSWATSD